MASAMFSAKQKILVALVEAAAICTCVEVVIGYTTAIAFPRSFFEVLGKDFGWFLVDFSTFTIPYFIVSVIVLPVLGFVATSETFKYAFVTLIGFWVLAIWRMGDLSGFVLSVSDTAPRILGVFTILFSGWLVGRRYAAT